MSPDSRETSGKKCGVYAEFKTKAGGQIELRVGISYVSFENARRNLAQTAGQTFEQVKAKGQQ